MMRSKRFHTLNPQADLLQHTGYHELYQKLQQLDEAALLVEEGKLKREVYEALVENVKRSIEAKQSQGKNSKRERGMFDGLLSGLRAERDEDDVSPEIMTMTANSKPIVEDYLMKRTSKSGGLRRKQWKRRYCVLYERALVIYKHKGDAKPLTSIILTPEFFVSQSHSGGDEGEEDELRTGEEFDDEGSIIEGDAASSQGASRRPLGKPNGDPPFTFILSDLTMKYFFAAEDSDDLKYWIHIMTSVLRKIMEEDEYFDTPKLMNAPMRDPQQIARDFEKRKEAYQKSQRKATIAKTQRRSWFRRRQGQAMSPEEWQAEEQRWEEEGTTLAREEVTARLLAEERARVKALEDEQTKRQEELDKVRQFAEEWKARAETNQAKIEEAETRAQKAESEEKRLNEELQLMHSMREKNIEREDAIRAQQEITQNQLDAVENRRRQSQHPAAMEEYENQIKALEAKLAALQSALNVDLDNLDWDGTLEMAEEKLKECVPHMMSDDPHEASEAANEFDQWDKIIRNHADYKKREAQKWIDWEAAEAQTNEECFETMTQIVPPQVITGCSEAYLESRGLKPMLAKRVMQTKIFQFLYMDKDSIAKLHIADLSSRYIPQGLDIVELRAIYTRLPDEFHNDRDGRKKLWLEQYRSKLFALTEKEKVGQLTPTEKRHPAYRTTTSSAASGPGAVGPKMKKKKKKKGGPKAQVAKKVNTKALEMLFAGGGPPRPPPGAGGGGDDDDAPPRPMGGPFGGGPSPRVLEMMRRGQAQQEEESAGASAAADAAEATDDAGDDDDDDAPPAPRKNSRRKTSNPRGSNPSMFRSVRNMFRSSDAAENGEDGEDASQPPFTRPPSGPIVVPEELSQRSTSLKKSRKPSMTEEQRLLAASVRGMMDEHKAHANKGYEPDDFDESSAPAFDFGVNYGNENRRNLSKQRAGEFSRGVERGMDKLCQFIKEEGQYDPAEGGLATITFGDLFEKYQLSDMLVGLLMRAKKYKRIKYEGDMLFQGIHDQVKITLLVE
mmetsp:Transcript_10863/g.18513  ORF Transcript_10863/g.18513 Transcript_10863/m.18513 type:complete len:1011 (-) Transcript_10863:745-3777(-)|eukprot:CAMPEP_0171502884 /NCGR_PEP_ID=MMETSP0958-20121227/10490_1 /TAXON_ID=87120 /ORGANISM="Aurantiochytrium limacinum, Strain ATCCMYA-1381" /LENGTH=1010 /DNA_ID=CAMNT_0012038117 /DNA_START=130 /DNA_END=3162 /DNA_ORIENTATION=+